MDFFSFWKQELGPFLLENGLDYIRWGVGIFTAVSVLNRKQDPMSCLGWLLGLALFPLLTSIMYLVGGLNPFQDLARRKKHSRDLISSATRASDRQRIFAENKQALAEKGFIGFNNVTNYISSLNARPVDGKSILSLLQNGSNVYQHFHEAIDKAEKYVLVQFYQFLPDTIGRHFLDLLSKKAQEGVLVRILYDGLGSYGLREEVRAKYHAQGVKTAPFLPRHPIKQRFQINWRNHRKLLICDGKMAFTGGMNIGETYLEGPDRENPRWIDTHFCAEGSVVLLLQQIFQEDWHFATDEVLELPALKSTEDLASPSLVHVVNSGPSDENTCFHTALISILNEAQRRVWLVTPYFIPDKALLQAMSQAVARGVDVLLLIPYRSNHPITDFCSRSYFEALWAANIRVHRYLPGVIHAKMLLADEDLVLSGSSNLDYRSFFLNFEIDLLVRDRALAATMDQLIRSTLEKSSPLTEQDLPSNRFPIYLPQRIIRLFSPLL